MKFNFFKKTSLIVVIVSLLVSVSCAKKKEDNSERTEAVTKIEKPFFNISLAQWSLHIAMDSLKTLSPFDFAKTAKELGFEGVEYVSQLYTRGMKNEDKAMMIPQIAEQLKEQSDLHGIKNVLIMVDEEGDLAHPDKALRDKAIENHSLWIDAAAFLGCTSIRVNLSPYDNVTEAEWHGYSVDGLGRLAIVAAKKNINVIVENHGGISSNAQKLVAVIAEVNMSNCGTLPDFGNFCIDGSPKGVCNEAYDRYKGVAEMMPYAKGVSAKSYDFDADGNETRIDFERMLQIVKKAGYSGYIGVEYEGGRLSEEEGIIATKELLLRLGKEI